MTATYPLDPRTGRCLGCADCTAPHMSFRQCAGTGRVPLCTDRLVKVAQQSRQRGSRWAAVVYQHEREHKGIRYDLPSIFWCVSGCGLGKSGYFTHDYHKASPECCSACKGEGLRPEIRWGNSDSEALQAVRLSWLKMELDMRTRDGRHQWRRKPQPGRADEIEWVPTLDAAIAADFAARERGA